MMESLSRRPHLRGNVQFIVAGTLIYSLQQYKPRTHLAYGHPPFCRRRLPAGQRDSEGLLIVWHTEVTAQRVANYRRDDQQHREAD